MLRKEKWYFFCYYLQRNKIINAKTAENEYFIIELFNFMYKMVENMDLTNEKE